MAKQIVVVAPGAVGGVIGGLLSKAGERVWSIDHWPERVQVLKANGLRIAIGGRHEDGDLRDLERDYRVPVRGYHVYQACTLGVQFDIAFVAAKAYDALWLARLIEPHLKPEGYIVALQGGAMDDQIARVAGDSRVLGCVYGGAAWLVEPDVVWQATVPEAADTFVVGELDGSETPRIRELAALLGAAGATRITGDIAAARWTRLTYDSMTAALAAVTGIEAHEGVDDASYRAAAIAVGREAIQVGQAIGRSLDPLFGLGAAELEGDDEAVLERLLRAGAGYAGAGYASFVRQDLQRGRPSEVAEHLNGLIVSEGRAAGVPVVANERLIEMYDRVARGKTGPDSTALAVLTGK